MSNPLKQAQIAQAVALLKAGKLVAFPTETVYGLGADAANPAAVQRIFIAKGRPADHPVIVHLAESAQMTQWARDIPELAWRLAEKFWPGPLTLILKRSVQVADILTGGQATIGLRVPSHLIAQQLLSQFGGGIAAPSANKFGHISPTLAEHVQQELGNEVDLILDGGASTLGIESAIIDLSGAVPRVLRPGPILESELISYIQKFEAFDPKESAAIPLPRVSGQLASHYAPRTPLYIIPGSALNNRVVDLIKTKSVSVLALNVQSTGHSQSVNWYSMPSDAVGYAHEFYATLRAADADNSMVILVEAPPDSATWAPLWNRLRKAAAGF